MRLLSYFESAGVPATGLSPIISVIDLSDDSKPIEDQAMTEVGNGFYKFIFTAFDNSKDYAIFSDGGSTLSDIDRYIASSSEIASVVNDVWEEPISEHVSEGTFGHKTQNVGGGVSLTADIVMMLKRLSDNSITKKDMKKLIENLTGATKTVNDNILQQQESSKDKISKMTSDFNDKIDLIIKKSDINRQDYAFLTEQIKSNFNNINKEIKNNNIEMDNLVNVNSNMMKLIETVNTDEFSEIKTKLEQNSDNFDSLKEKVNNLHKKLTDDIVRLGELNKDQFNDSKTREEIISNNIGKDLKKIKIDIDSLFKNIDQNKIELGKDITEKIKQTGETIENDLIDISEKNKEFVKQINHNNINCLMNELKEMKSNIRTDFNEKFKENNFKVDDIKNKLDSIDPEVNHLVDIKNRLSYLDNNFKSFAAESITKDDSKLNSQILNGEIAKLSEKINNFETSILKKIKESLRKNKSDDINDVLSQISLIKNES